MQEEAQRVLARRLLEELEKSGVRAVLVGSTAVVALHLFPRTSKDADALAAPELGMDAAREVMAGIAARTGLALVETGDNALSLISAVEGPDGWRMDLLVPGDGLIPARAAALVHKHAVATEIGPAAIPEHILVMKAVAYGDSLGKGREARALEYESDVLLLRRIRHDWRWRLVRGLLEAFPDARRGPAARLIRRTFGMEMAEPEDPNI